MDGICHNKRAPAKKYISDVASYFDFDLPSAEVMSFAAELEKAQGHRLSGRLLQKAILMNLAGRRPALQRLQSQCPVVSISGESAGDCRPEWNPGPPGLL
jgi:hypothetical protein